jgi:hypothetical protein
MREELASGRVDAWRQPEKNLFEIHARPQFGIDRAPLQRTSAGDKRPGKG